MLVHYCPDCDTDFRPDIAVCSDCGGPLQPRFDEEDGDVPGTESPAVLRLQEPKKARMLPEGSYLPFFRTGDFEDADRVANLLGEADLPYMVTTESSWELVLGIRPQDRVAAEGVVAGQFPVLPVGKEADAEDGQDADEFKCPACGEVLRAGTAECGECGLVLAHPETYRCPNCGTERDVPSDPCPRCAPSEPL